MPGAEKIGAKKAGGGKLTKNPSQCLGRRRLRRHRPAGANSRRIRVNAWGREDGSDIGRWGQTHEESESMPGAEKKGATKAGGGKLTKNPSQCLGPRRWRRQRH